MNLSLDNIERFESEVGKSITEVWITVFDAKDIYKETVTQLVMRAEYKIVKNVRHFF